MFDGPASIQARLCEVCRMIIPWKKHLHSRKKYFAKRFCSRACFAKTRTLALEDRAKVKHRDAYLARISAWNKKRYHENPQKFIDQHMAWARENPEKAQAWAKRHPEETRRRRQQWYVEHKESEAEKNKAWRAAHPTLVRAQLQRRRAARAGAKINDFTDEQWKSMCELYDYRCVYCPPECKECQRRKHKLTQDHIIPLSKGGDNTASNIVPACRSHNSKKNARGILCPIQPVLVL